MLKYKMTDNTLMVNGRVLHQIEALKDFSIVRKGEVGGWIEDYSNLSQEGRAWVADNACVYASARVIQNAFVCGNARVAGSALVAGDAFINGNACVYERAKVTDCARVYGNSHVYGHAQVFCNAVINDNAHIYGLANIYDQAQVCGNAYVYEGTCVSGCASVGGNARIYGRAHVGFKAFICENAVVCEEMKVNYSKIISDLRTDIAASLRGQCNLLLEDNKIRAYKIVNKDLTSVYDRNFTYKIGEVVEAENPNETNASCASGLHFSNLTYWDDCVNDYFNKVYLIAEIDVNDIITIQSGKIRCRKAKILNAVSI